MILRLTAATLFAVFCLGMPFASDGALAAAKMKQATICPAAKITQCLGPNTARCTRKNSCGACAQWSCTPVFFPPIAAQ
jgi:hypothetical protein